MDTSFFEMNTKYISSSEVKIIISHERVARVEMLTILPHDRELKYIWYLSKKE